MFQFSASHLLSLRGVWFGLWRSLYTRWGCGHQSSCEDHRCVCACTIKCVMKCLCQNSALLLMQESFDLFYDLVGIHSHQDLHEFLREAELMQNFDHENVVKLLGKMLIHSLVSVSLQCTRTTACLLEVWSSLTTVVLKVSLYKESRTALCLFLW